MMERVCFELSLATVAQTLHVSADKLGALT